MDCPICSWVSAAFSYFLSAKLLSTRDAHAFGQRAVVKLQNQAALQFRPRGTWGEDQASPYKGFSARRGSWARRSREASCSTETAQRPAGLAGRAGAVKHAQLAQNWGWAWLERDALLQIANNRSARKYICMCMPGPMFVRAFSVQMWTPTHTCTQVQAFLHVCAHRAVACTHVCALVLQVCSLLK